MLIEKIKLAIIQAYGYGRQFEPSDEMGPGKDYRVEVSKLIEDVLSSVGHERADLVRDIMNLPTKKEIEDMPTGPRITYKEGHRDARHAAIELINNLRK